MAWNTLVSLIITGLIPLAEKWIWTWVGLPPMRRWQKVAVTLMNLAGIALWVGWRHGFPNLWIQPELRRGMSGLLVMALLLSASVFFRYESSDDSISKDTPHP
jgi:predicted Abi (CAAX) family protease